MTYEEKKALDDFDRVVCKILELKEINDTWLGRIRARRLLWEYLSCEEDLRKVYEKQAKTLWNMKLGE